jgi:hypothetical protein
MPWLSAPALTTGFGQESAIERAWPVKDEVVVRVATQDESSVCGQICYEAFLENPRESQLLLRFSRTGGNHEPAFDEVSEA